MSFVCRKYKQGENEEGDEVVFAGEEDGGGGLFDDLGGGSEVEMCWW